MADKKSTRLVKAGRRKKWTGGVVNPPVYHASTVLFDTYQEMRDGVKKAFSEELFYGRLGTPTLWALEEALAELEGARGAKIYPSGMAAITTSLLSVLKAGDHLLIADTVYEPTRKFASQFLPRLGIEADFFDPMIGAGIAKLFKDNTKVVFLETPGSLTFEVPDLPAIAKAAHARDMYVLCDNTWATPLYHNALEKGADISIHAATKYIVGHADAMLGVIVTSTPEQFQAVKWTGNALGNCAGPDDCYLGLRGIRTLATRLRRHQETGLVLARWLRARPEVARVMHPAPEDDPGHAIWRRDFSGASGLFGLVLKPFPAAAVAAMLDGMKLFAMGASWGGYESLILPTDPARNRTATRWDAPGPSLRIHAGLEDCDDRIADLEAGFTRLNAAA